MGNKDVQGKEKEMQEVAHKEQEATVDYSKFRFEDAEKKFAEKDSASRNKEALKLIRCRISCNNVNKQNYPGEIFCVRNKVLGEVKKFIPFNTITHVPEIMLNMIREKKYQKFKEERTDNGNKIMRPYLIDEYNIETLAPITVEELEAIKQKQLAEGKSNA